MNIHFKRESSVATVTDYYLDVISQALTQAGHHVTSGYEWDHLAFSPKDWALIITANHGPRLWRKRIPYCYWAQGIWPEESLLRHGSRLRFQIQSWLEKHTLKRAKFVFFVSESMKKHFEKKYKLNFDKKCYIMPCANEQFHAEAFDTPGKYENNVFCYAGGLSQWQCFEETVALYKKIEEQCPDAHLLLLVKDREAAVQMLQKYDVKNYSIDYVSIEELPRVLGRVKFGFVLRQESPINAVATPTKVVTYLCNGLIPIYSQALTGIQEILDGAAYPVCYKNDGDISQIIQRMEAPLRPEEVRSDLERVYQQNYHRQTHVQGIASHFCGTAGE